MVHLEVCQEEVPQYTNIYKKIFISGNGLIDGILYHLCKLLLLRSSDDERFYLIKKSLNK